MNVKKKTMTNQEARAISLIVESIVAEMERPFKRQPESDEIDKAVSTAGMCGFGNPHPHPRNTRNGSSKKSIRIALEVQDVIKDVFGARGYSMSGAPAFIRGDHEQFARVRAAWIDCSAWRPSDDHNGNSQSHGGKIYGDEFFVEIRRDPVDDPVVSQEQIDRFTTILKTIMEEEFQTENINVTYVTTPEYQDTHDGPDVVDHEWVVHFEDKNAK